MMLESNHNALEIPRAKTVVILAEDFAIYFKTFGRRNITYIVIACDVVEANIRIEFLRNTEILCDLGRIRWLVHEVSVTTTNEGCRRFAVAIANSRFVSWENPLLLVYMPN